jgi:hypothetical protein
MHKLTSIKIVDAEPLRRSLDVIHPRHRPLRSEAQAFLQIVREAAKQDSGLNANSGRRRRRKVR